MTCTRRRELQKFLRETLIYSEFPWHMEVPPFSAADKLLKMKKKAKSHFAFFVL